MNITKNNIEFLFPAYFASELTESDQLLVDAWRKENPENETLFRTSKKAWESISILHEMEQFNSFEALKKINTKISLSDYLTWWNLTQKVAAILLLPILFYASYITVLQFKKPNEFVTQQTVTSRQGMVTDFLLADGTHVWLNAGSELQFPTRFTGGSRTVKLKGEAFFEVTKNPELPFSVNVKSLNVEVLGTSFNVIGYCDETKVEVVLVEGKVSLSTQKNQIKKIYGEIQPGQRAIYSEELGKVFVEEVNVDKYVAWRDGYLMFRDDKMEDVISRLSRWYNVEIVIKDPEIKNYIYTATFRNETIDQVMKLLKLSAPIDYRKIENKPMPGNEFKKQKIVLMKNKS
jgi:ferric-dicitrate binding protein FerR (iron transport regulator)